MLDQPVATRNLFFGIMSDIDKTPVVDGEPYDVNVAGEEDDLPSEKKGTSADRHAMWRMGKVQEMRVSPNHSAGYPNGLTRSSETSDSFPFSDFL